MCAKNCVNIFSSFLDIPQNVEWPRFFGPPGKANRVCMIKSPYISRCSNLTIKVQSINREVRWLPDWLTVILLDKPGLVKPTNSCHIYWCTILQIFTNVVITVIMLTNRITLYATVILSILPYNISIEASKESFFGDKFSSWSCHRVPSMYKKTTRRAQRAQTSAKRQWIQISDFWIQTVIRIVTKIELIGPWAMTYPSK